MASKKKLKVTQGQQSIKSMFESGKRSHDADDETKEETGMAGGTAPTEPDEPTPGTSKSDESTARTPTTTTDEKERKFQPKWLRDHPWLTYDKTVDKMYCTWCRDAGKDNTMAKGNAVWKTSTLARHLLHRDHKVVMEGIRAEGQLVKAMNVVQTQEEKAVVHAMKGVYWIVKEGLPMAKYESLIKLFKHLHVPDIEALNVSEDVRYESRTTGVELLTALSNDIDGKIATRVQASPAITILTDESTDVINHRKLTIMARICDPKTLKPSTVFIEDVSCTSGKGKDMYNDIKSALEKRGVGMRKIDQLGTDGAAAMVGTKEGLTGHMKRENPHLINNHCSSHRLALCSSQAAQGIKIMKDFELALESIYYHFKHAPGKAKLVEDFQKVLQEPELKYREVHEVRWLSFFEAVQTVQRTLDSLISYLTHASAEGDSKAEGVKRKVATVQFVTLTYAVIDILHPVMKLSLKMQAQDIDIGTVRPAIDNCVQELTELRDGKNPLGKVRMIESLPESVKTGTFKGHKINLPTNPASVSKSIHDFIQAIIDNIERRFPEKEMMSAFGVLAMRPLSFLPAAEVDDWGCNELESLLQFYGHSQSHQFQTVDKEVKTVVSDACVDVIGAREEWRMVKQVVRQQQYPRDNAAHLWELLKTFHGEEFPNLFRLAALALTHPIHTADCERSFSTQNLVVTKRRNRTSSELCDKLMRIAIEGPSLSDHDFTDALALYRMKYRFIFGQK